MRDQSYIWFLPYCKAKLFVIEKDILHISVLFILVKRDDYHLLLVALLLRRCYRDTDFNYCQSRWSLLL